MGIFGSENKAVQPDENKAGELNENTNQLDVHDEIDKMTGDQSEPSLEDDANDDQGRVVETGDDGQEIEPKTNTTWYMYEDRKPDGEPMSVGVIGYFRLIKGVLHYSPLLKNELGEDSKFGERDGSQENIVDVEAWPERQRSRLSVIADELQSKH